MRTWKIFTLGFNRTFIGLAALCFAGVAVTIWAAPAEVGRWLGLESTRVGGAALLRSDLGGLFAAMSALCGAAAWTMRRPYALGAATVLTGIVTGRALGWVSQGGVGRDVAEMVVELALIASLLALTRGAQQREGPASGRRRRLAFASVALVLVAAVGVFLIPSVQERIYAAGAARRTSTVNTAPLEPDALRVAVCGSSAPLPSPSRAKSCVAVFAGGRFYVVDAGPESVENLVLWGIPLSSIGGVLLTHFHSDHIGDLGELNLQTWAGGRPGPLHVYGGPGVDRVVAGFDEAYRLDQGYRTAHHGEQVMPTATWPMVAHTIDMAGVDEVGRTVVVLDQDGLRITAIAVDHSPIRPAYAYRFDYRGRSAFITGDLKFHPSLATAAKGVDLFLSEAIATSMTRALGEGARSAGRAGATAVLHDIEDYHITPEQAADAANGAGARLLAFYHLLPAPDNGLARRVFGRGVDERRRGDWTIADDGSVYTMPIGSTDVRIGHVAE